MTRLHAGCASRLLLTTIIAAGAAAPALAIGVYGKTFQLEQRDGSMIEARIWGDEYYGVTESLDGYTLVYDVQSGLYCYARLNAAASDLESTGVPVGTQAPGGLNLPPHIRIRAEAAQEKARVARQRFRDQEAEVENAITGGLRGLRATTTGTVQGITLIVQFPDVLGTITPASVANYCNQVGYTANGNNGSVRDYYFAVSDGLLTYTNYVPAAYYTASHNRSYYTDPAVSYGQRARELITEALTSLNNSGFDFSQYDVDHDGDVDALNCFYAGPTVNQWAQGLWPHASSLSYCADGVCTNRYQITNMGGGLTLGTFCHENGHMLMGWPDLYDYDYDSTGAGSYCLMAYGTSDTNPCEPGAYCKYTAGWFTPTVLSGPQATLSVPASSTNVAYKYNNPSKPAEYFLIENRQKTGRDSGLPDAGLLIWHIDTGGSNSYNQGTPSQHFEAAVMQADGRRDLENNANYGDSTDLFGGAAYPEFTPTTNPNSNWWNVSDSNLAITSISTPSANMTFVYANLRDCNGNGQPDTAEIAANPGLDCQSNGVLDGCELSGNDCNANLKPDECDLAGDDCNANLIPDECDLAGDDCNANAVPDECDVENLFADISTPADQLVCDGTPASFTVQAPAGSTYQWYFGQNPLADGGGISGATSNTLNIANAGAGEIGSYRCRVSKGCISTLSMPGALGIISNTLSAAQQPVAQVTLCATAGQSASFDFHASDEQAIHYRWYRDGVPLDDDGRITGSHSFHLLIASAAPSDAAAYSCRATNDCGGAVNSDPARGKLVVVGANFEGQPQATCTNAGGQARFQSRVDASADTGFFWYRNGNLLSNGTDASGMVISGASSSKLKLTNVPAAYNGQSIQLITFVSSPTCIGQSDLATLTVGPSCGNCRFAGDLDGDLDADLRDMAIFEGCLGQFATGPCECANADAGNAVIDLADWDAIEIRMNGPG